MITKTSFYFVRHGVTDWNTSGRIQGCADIPLNAVGMRQAEAVAQATRDVQFSSIVSSPLRRALQTANSFALHHPHAHFRIIPELRERSWGVDEGCEKDDQFRALYLQIHERGLPAEAESTTMFLHRVFHGVHEALAMPGPVLIVAHGHFFRVLCMLLNITAPVISNASLIYFNYADSQWTSRLIVSPDEIISARTLSQDGCAFLNKGHDKNTTTIV